MMTNTEDEEGMLTEDVEPQPAPTPNTRSDQEATANLTEEPMADGGQGQPAPAGPQVDYEAARKAAVEHIYGDKFESMLKVFEANGPEGFPHAMATVINGALQAAGNMGHEDAARLGMELFQMMLLDVVKGGVAQGVTMDQINAALPATIKMYAESHNDITDQDMANFTDAIQQKMRGGANV